VIMKADIVDITKYVPLLKALKIGVVTIAANESGIHMVGMFNGALLKYKLKGNATEYGKACIQTEILTKLPKTNTHVSADANSLTIRAKSTKIKASLLQEQIVPSFDTSKAVPFELSKLAAIITKMTINDVADIGDARHIHIVQTPKNLNIYVKSVFHTVFYSIPQTADPFEASILISAWNILKKFGVNMLVADSYVGAMNSELMVIMPNSEASNDYLKMRSVIKSIPTTSPRYINVDPKDLLVSLNRNKSCNIVNISCSHNRAKLTYSSTASTVEDSVKVTSGSYDFAINIRVQVLIDLLKNLNDNITLNCDDSKIWIVDNHIVYVGGLESV